MAHGLNSVGNRVPSSAARCKSDTKSGGMGSRRIFAPHFKLQVLDSYRNDADCKGNQRATARKYGIHRRQIQKWLQCENNLRNSVGKCKAPAIVAPEARKCGVEVSLRSGQHRQRDDSCPEAYSRCADGRHKEGPAYGAGGVRPPNSPVALVQDAYRQTAPLGQESPPRVPPSPPCCPEETRPSSADRGAAPAAPLDYTVRERPHSNPQPSPSPQPPPGSAPIDLSLKKSPPASPLLCSSPSDLAVQPQQQPFVDIPSSPARLLAPSSPSPDAWDLSIRRPSQKRPYEEDIAVPPPSGSPSSSSTTSENAPSKPVKLFKPYLLDARDEDVVSQTVKEECHEKDASGAKATLQIFPTCCGGNRFISSVHESEVHLYNNNNHVYPDYGCYVHGLQPEMSTTFDHYYTINKNYIYGTDYDKMSMCSSYEYSSFHSQSSPPLKQRQSYSVDFKLSAIQCYYQDSMCRGNQRAVANKYNIHRRQVQKWLKQEEDLRTRSDHISKQLSVVR